MLDLCVTKNSWSDIGYKRFLIWRRSVKPCRDTKILHVDGHPIYRNPIMSMASQTQKCLLYRWPCKHRNPIMSMACQTQISCYDDGLQNTEILPYRWPPNIQSLHDMWSDLKSVKGLLRMCCWHTRKCWMTTVWCVNNACFSNIDLTELTELTLRALYNCVRQGRLQYHLDLLDMWSDLRSVMLYRLIDWLCNVELVCVEVLF